MTSSGHLLRLPGDISLGRIGASRPGLFRDEVGMPRDSLTAAEIDVLREAFGAPFADAINSTTLSDPASGFDASADAFFMRQSLSMRERQEHATMCEFSSEPFPFPDVSLDDDGGSRSIQHPSLAGFELRAGPTDDFATKDPLAPDRRDRRPLP